MGHGLLRPDLTRPPLLLPISPSKAVGFGEDKRKRAGRERERVGETKECPNTRLLDSITLSK